MFNPQHIKSGNDFEPRRKSWWHRHTRRLALKRLSYDQHYRHQKVKVWINYLISLGILGVIFGLIFILFIFAWTTKDLPDPNKLLDRQMAQTTTIYDRTGKTILYQLHGDVNRSLINLADLPDYVKWATLTVEDRDFYNHSGFSLRGMARALFNDLTSGSTQGGSTITQQFVKNAILTSQKTITRKIKEIILAYRIEQKFTKDQILQMYFNEIPYGSVVYGVQAASQTYFGKDAKDLSLAQAATLAAMVQRPTYFSPYGSHLDKLFERQQWILNEMANLGHATKAETEAAKAEKIEFRAKSNSMIAPHFVMYVRELLADQYGELAASENGYKVTTTLDANYQKAAEKAIADHIDGNNKNWNASNASLVALDTKTGQILALVGSADFNNVEIDGQVNVATSPRQPGSSMKPLIYATAFSRGYTPETVLYDVVTNFKTDTNQDYTPHNYDSKEHGLVTMRQALAGSLNIPSVKTLYLAGINNVLDNAEKIGYTTLSDRSRFGLSLVLGGGEVKLLEHTAAYAAYAREGIYHQPMAILKIEDAKGNVLYEYKDENDNPGTQVMAAEPIRSLNNILTDNASRAFIFGEKNYLTLPDRQVAAKTGTTNDYHDAWTMGFTPSLAAGVWVGNADNAAMKRGADGSVVAAPIWNEFMKSILTNQPVETFNPPPENISDKPVLRGQSGGAPIRIDRISGKLATALTPEDLIVEKTYSQLHDILYYVNKDDPNGPPPADPFADQQFATFEDGVRNWAQKQGITLSGETPPTEYDDIHTQANQPILAITFPQNGTTINSRNFTVDISAAAARSIRQAQYYLDDVLIGTVTAEPWNFFGTANVASGIHTLKVKVSDDVENSASKSIDLNFLLP